MKKSKLERSLILHDDAIINKIYFIRGEKVMMDRDLADLYGVPTKSLNLAVKRNIKRFPEDFMFRITKEEYASLRFQFETLKRWQHSKYFPYAFTEQGVAMLSSVLNSERSIHVNIQIIRVYTKMITFLSTHKDILLKLEQLERKTDSRDAKIRLIFDYIKQLIKQESKPRKQIGYKTGRGK